MSNPATLRFQLEGLPELQFTFRTTTHHRYPAMPVVRMEVVGDPRLAAYGQYLIDGTPRVKIFYTGAECSVHDDTVEAAVTAEILRLLSEWPEELKQAGVLHKP